MDLSQCFNELTDYGYTSAALGYSLAYALPGQCPNIVQMHGETPEDFHHRAVVEARRVRELDAQKA